MQPVRVLLYADMEAIIPHCVAAAEMLRSQLGAHVVMAVVDKATYFDQAFKNYELYDHNSIFRFSKLLKPARQAGVDESAGADTSVSAAGDVTVSATSASVLPTKPVAGSGLRKRIDWELYRATNITRRLLQATSPGRILEECLKAWHRSFFIRRFLRAVRPDIMIFAEDNIERMSTTFINEGNKQGIPSIIVPFTIPNPLEPAKAYRDRRFNQVRGPSARLVARLFPKWRFRLDDRDLLRVPASAVLALELFRQSSPAPWILNRGNAARIALDSEAQRNAYLKLGFPESQLSVVGDVHGAILRHGLLNKPRLLADLIASHGLPPDRPLILCGFPPDQFASKTDDFEFQDYNALIAAWIGCFQALGDRANVLVRPHPRISLTRFDRFGAPNVRYTSQPTAELVPLCDLYVASISATIRWAIACGIPVINYDTYRYRYGDYDSAAGVISVESLPDFRDRLTRFANDPAFAVDLTQRQESVMRHWGIVDDKLGERFAALTTAVIKEIRANTAS